MSNALHDLLVAAAEPSEPGFDAGDVERRVTRRRTRRRLVTGGAVALAVVVLGATAGVLATGDEGTEVVAGSDPDAAVGADDLVGDRWVLSAVAEVRTVRPPLAWLEFDQDGTLRGDDGCNGVAGQWSLDGRRLTTHAVVSNLAGCPSGALQLSKWLDNPVVDRFDGSPDTLKLMTDDGFVAFKRLSTGGRAVTEEDLAGWWTTVEEGDLLRFKPGGALTVETCGEARWSLDDSRLTVTWPSGTYELCQPLDLMAALADRPRLVLEGSTLYLSTEDTVWFLHRAGVGNPATTTTTTGAPEAPTFTYDPGLRWSVVLVEAGDVLNVRAQPDAGAAVVDTLAPGTTGLVVSGERERVAGEDWRQVLAPGGTGGWANDRYLAAQPAEFGDGERQAVTDLAQALVEWTRGEGDPGPGQWLSEDGLWVGGIGVYADLPTPFTRIPATELEDRSGWTRDRTFSTDLDNPCRECTKPLVDFLGLDTLRPDHRYLVDDANPLTADYYRDGPIEFVAGTHSITVDQPASSEATLDWQRITVWFEWSSGAPRAFAISTWGWTP